MIQAVFFDIDGTLIDHDHGSVVPQSTLDSLAALRRKGIKVFVATGRAPFMLKQVFGFFPFDGAVSLNGQLVKLADGTVLHRMAHDPEDIRELIPLVHKEGFPCVILEEIDSFPVEDSPVVRRHYSWLEQDLPPLYDLSRLDNHPVLQFLAYMTLEEAMGTHFPPHVEVTNAGGDIMDVVPKGGGKEVGISAAADYYGFSQENIMVFGDGANDARMLRWAGTGVALGNGVPSAKAAADYVTSPIWEDGIRRALLHLGVLSPADFSFQ